VQERGGAVAELVLPDLNLALGVPGAERIGHLDHELAARGAEKAHPQQAADLTACGHRALDTGQDLLVGGPDVAAELAADRGERYPAAAALEQGYPRPAVPICGCSG
jgi:hypothetical protein